jgi:hypothetical protein
MQLFYAQLKEMQRNVRDGFTPDLGLRTHRSLSWLERAEKEEGDDDARFIFLWVAFNAAYAHEIEFREQFSERQVFMKFLERLIELDHNNLLYEILWSKFSGSIRLLIENKYVYQPFWDFHNGLLSETEWKQRFEKSKAAALWALGNNNTIQILAVVFDRLYVLRNQLVHGGATWNSRVNRDQVRDSANIMGNLVPAIIYIMMDAPSEDWGTPSYPVVE